MLVYKQENPINFGQDVCETQGSLRAEPEVTGIAPIKACMKMNRKKKNEVLLYWIIRIVSLIILCLTIYIWIIHIKTR